MREFITPRTFKLLSCAAISVVLASCSSSPVQKKGSPAVRSGDAITSPPGLDINRAHKDGAPWWDVDISKIPDATPTVHTGNYKANPYTVLGQTYYPIQDSRNYRAEGIASWYGTKFHGQNTANGEFYDLYGMSAAHKTLPLPAYVKVTNLANNRSVVLRVNDRGPFYSDRIIDLSYAAAKKLGYAESGTARVRVEGIDPVQWWADRGQKPPMVLNQPQVAQNQPIPASTGRVEQWTPPPQQHAAAVVPVQVAGNSVPDSNGGMFLQVGAFANPDAAELLRAKLSTMVSAPVFISSIVRNQQTLHRVRLGPISSRGEVEQMQDSVRLANLGQAKLVTAD